ncbi:MAG TPA: L,D-transpeptidase family protein [Hyphomicrobiaceae bacterium]|nr:L,D-transpeptidase family protein [Hyphomicrobiaceae bacterium]
MGKTVRQRHLVVRALSRRATSGHLTFGNLRFSCALGRGGQKALKREGDGATPVGRLAVREAYYRGDRLPRPHTALPIKPVRRSSGWCDRVGDRNYNRAVRLPYAGSAERMWREDGLYDLTVVLGYNDRPRIQGRGSAIFMHVAREGLRPTEGCIALRRRDLVRLLSALTRGAVLRIGL